MAPKGEALAVTLANAPTAQAVLSLVSTSTSGGVVHVGRDTRSHSPALTQLTIRAAQAMGATVYMHGVVTTPILHYCVMMANPQYLPPLIPRRPNVVGYYEQVAHAYMGLLATSSLTSGDKKLDPIVVDCACGVGYAHTQRLNDTLQKLGAARPLLARNAPDEGPLNEGCGSEHVQKHILPPQWYSADITANAAIPYAASLDGDSDRIVFFAQEENNQFTLLDGDKIAVLICDFLQEQVSALEKAISAATNNHQQSSSSLNLGVVQTAYANGASTKYMERVLGKDRVKIAKTGVKHVHKAAHDYFDVGVYFEANGHGTVLFGNAFYEFLADADKAVRGHVALQRLQLLPALINQAVGDALSDLLLVDAILQIKGWTITDDWKKLYTDLPSRQCKVKVEDRTMIQTNENETRCTSPVELQDALDAAIVTVGGSLSRCFVRPSGTENVVRVYAEAPTPQQADELATQAAKLVFEICRGVGQPPVFPSSKM
jgi:phosphoacetylglucosamine mutase